MHQFAVYRIGPEIKIAGINLSFTNASLFMLLSALTICGVLFLGKIAAVTFTLRKVEKLKISSRSPTNPTAHRPRPHGANALGRIECTD